MSTPVSTSTAAHYTWGSECDGWRLVDTPNLSVIEERVPSGAGEIRHNHARAHQFFRILSGEAIVEIEGSEHRLGAGDGIEVPPGLKHTFLNKSAAEVRFLVISAPSTRGDRMDDA